MRIFGFNLNIVIMSKTYNYPNLKFPVADETDVILDVKYISDGNSSNTLIYTPGIDDRNLQGQGKINIGKGKQLRAQTTYITTNLNNPVPHVQNIKVEYKLNGELIISHSNPVSETRSAIINLDIDFPAQ